MYPSPPPTPPPSGPCSPEAKLRSILAGRYEFTGILGVGAYGTVFKARDIETDQEYAVKALNKSGLDPRQRAFQDREIKLHYQASRHRNVVSMVKVVDSVDCTYVVLEYCPEGDLFAKITDEGHYIDDDFKAKHVFLQILDAVSHCHLQGIFHRDLKPENILVKDNGWTVKLADFGLATQDRVTADFGCGSTFYMSPECQQSNPKPYSCYASAPNDVWALGVILVNLTCGRNPWKRASMDDSTFKAFIRDRNFLQSILPISPELNFILQRIFDVDPRRRICLTELRELIIRCPRLTLHPAAASLPPSPPYTPVQEAMEAPLPSPSGVDTMDVPPMDPLPALQYPPPAADQGQMTYAYAPPSAAPVAACSPFLNQFTRISVPSIWSRCAQVTPQTYISRPACFWNLPVY